MSAQINPVQGRYARLATLVLLVGLLSGTQACWAVFHNLDFEDAVITPEPPGQDPGSVPFTVLASDALPHWTTNGTLGAPIIPYNSICLGPGCTSLHDGGSTFVAPLEGDFSVLLQGPVPFPEQVPLFVAQAGTVPPGASQVTMLVNNAADDPFVVSFDNGGGATPLALLSHFPVGVTARLVYDIAPFAGETGELRISSSASFESFVMVDDIQFIPEPSGLALLAVLCACMRPRRPSPD